MTGGVAAVILWICGSLISGGKDERIFDIAFATSLAIWIV